MSIWDNGYFVSAYRWMRIISCYYDTVPGIGRVLFFYDIQTDRQWAIRKE